MLQGLGFLVGATVMDVKVATTLASVIILAFMLTGGFYLQVRRKQQATTASTQSRQSPGAIIVIVSLSSDASPVSHTWSYMVTEPVIS